MNLNLLNFKKHFIFICLAVIVVVAFFLRIYKLSEVPGSLNPDEAALGYNAYSLLLTNADEHGKFLPLNLQSFGDWKLPIYPYIDAFSIKAFGLNEFAVRFPSVISGVLGVVLIYYISLLLFKRKTLAIFSAVLLAFSPWDIYFSHAAYEVNLATTIFLAAILAFLKYIYGKKKNGNLLILSSILLGLTMFTYHSYLVFAPIFALAIIIFYREDIRWNKITLISIGLFVLLVAISYGSTLRDGNAKVSALTIFNDNDIIYNRVEKFRGDSAPKNQLFEKVLYTKYLGISYQLGQNYIGSFSPSFLFDKGGVKLWHNLEGFGNLYLFDVLLLFIGFATLFWNKERSLKILLVWLFIAPIPSAITKDAPNSTRLYILMPLFVLIGSYGAYQIFVYLKKPLIRNYFIGGLLVFLYFLNVTYFLDQYFVHLNADRVRFWRYGYREVIKMTQNYPDYKVVMRGPENFPYIYFLFYDKYDPRKFEKEVQYYPPTGEGFVFVKSFGRYSFVPSINYSKLKKKTIYIDDTMLGDKKHAILLPSGEPVLGYLINN